MPDLLAPVCYKRVFGGGAQSILKQFSPFHSLMGEIRCLDMVHGCNNQLEQTAQGIHQAATSSHRLLKLNGSHACAISEIF